MKIKKVVIILIIFALFNFLLKATEADNSSLEVQVDIKTYGAVCDGQIDDSKAVNAAFLMGGTVVINGEINCDNKIININKPIKVIGLGSLKNATININNTSKVIMEGIKTTNITINISNSSLITIKKCIFDNIIADKYGFIYIVNGCKDINISDNSFSNIKYDTSASTYGCGIKVELNSSSILNLLIKNNSFKNVHGPAAVWIGYKNSSLSKIRIEDNLIQATENFGIELYGDNLKFSDTYITGNHISEIGSIRIPGTGAGCGGIYSSNNANGVFVTNNFVKDVREVGIEGEYELVSGNYIEDTGSDQLNYPISDSAGIYNGGSKIINNIIVNPGKDGGFYVFSDDKVSHKTISGNIIKNEFKLWKSGNNYNIGDLVVANNNWYQCIKEGISGIISPESQSGNINDNTCTWNYKKPLAKEAIDINAVKGIEYTSIENNSIMNIATFLSISKWVSNINLSGNTQKCDSSVLVKDYIHSYAP